MADNVDLNPGSGGATIAADDIGGVLHQRVKAGFGPDGSFTDVAEDAGLPVFPAVLDNSRIISRYLDTLGTGGGLKNANGNYSGAAQDFLIQPPAGQVFQIARLLIQIRDSGAFTASSYGNLGALANGIQLLIVNDGGTILDLTDGIPVKSNAHWSRLCYDAKPDDYGSGDNFLSVRFTFTRSGSAIRLDGDNTERLVARFNDDLSGLVEHYFLAQGWRTT